MTLARIIASGRGRLAARAVIEGLEYEFVSAKRMERTTSDGRTRVNGLDLADMVIGASADIMRATLKGQSLTLRIKDVDRIAGKRHGRATRALWRSPTVRAYLAADCAYSATTVNLGATGPSLPSAGVVHIGTEAIKYTSIVGGVLTGCTRGHWQTIGQSHYVADGEGLQDALVTDQPIGVEGRRVYLYLYGDGDDPQGDGTLRWRGVCATDVRWSGGICEIEVDPITRLLDSPLGGNLSSPVQIRGIHYTSASPWMARVMNADTGERADAKITGFWETQDEFCADATTAIAAAIADAGLTIGDGAVTITAEVGGYRVSYTADSTTPQRIFVAVFSDIDYAADGVTPILDLRVAWDPRGDGPPLFYGTADWIPAASSTESYLLIAPVPRATLGKRAGWDDGSAVPPGPEADYYLLHLGGLVIPTSNDALLIGSGDDVWPARVYSADATTRSVVVVDGIPGGFVRLDPNTEITFGWQLASGSWIDVIDALAFSPIYANTGAMPLIYTGDFVFSASVEAHVEAQRLATGRGFYLFEGGTTLAEMLAPELIVSGCYPRLSATGGVEFVRLSPPLPGASADVEVDDSAAFGSMIEKSPRGVLSQMVYRVGYDPRSDEWDDRTLTFRDVQSTSATRTPITLEVAQRSTDNGTWRGSGTGLVGINRDDVQRVAVQYLGLFGMPTIVVSAEVDARYMDALIGQTVSLSSSILPDVEDGCSPMVDRVGLIVSTACELATGRVSLGILLHTQRFTGYAPGFPVTSQTDNGGDEWDVDISISDYTTEVSVASWLTAGDLVRVVRPDSSVSAVDGTVVSVVDANTVRVQFDSSWAPPGYSWVLIPQASPNHNEADALARFCFVADSSATIEYADATPDAQVLA